MMSSLSRIFRPALALGLLVLAAGTAQAQAVWRCGDEGARYSSVPCAGGRQVDVADPVDSARRREAAQVSNYERQALQRLAAQRHERQAGAQGAPAGISRIPVRGQASASTKPGSKPKKKSSRKRRSAADPWTAQSLQTNG